MLRFLEISRRVSPSALRSRLAMVMLLVSGVMFTVMATSRFVANDPSPAWFLYALMALFCSLSLTCFLLNTRLAERLSRLAYACLAIFLVVAKLPLLLWTTTPENLVSEVTEVLFWLFVVYMLSALVLEQRAGLAGNLFMLLYSLALPVAANVLELPAANAPVPWFQLYVFQGATITVAFIVTYTREQHQRSTDLANSMRALAHTDFLTGLPNRRQLYTILEQHVEEKRRYGGTLSVILFDLDHFKHINDTFGHYCGDHVLEQVARIARVHLRKSDVIGRWGGEEFLIVALNTSQEQATVLAERLRAAIAEYPFQQIGTVTASFGVAPYKVNMSAQQLITQADTALYRAKDAGRNRVESAA